MSNQQAWHTDHKRAQDVPLPAFPPYMLRTHKAVKMIQKQVTAMITNSADAVALFPSFFNNEIFLEFLNLQQAVINRVLEQQQSWFTGISGVIQEYNEIKEVNTLSKYVEREYNIIGQMSALIAK
jgi:hypothetical protein